MKKVILCTIVLLASLNLTQLEAEDLISCERQTGGHSALVKAEVPVIYTLKIPAELDLQSFNKSDKKSGPSVSRKFAIELIDAEIGYNESILVTLKDSDLFLPVAPGVALPFESSLTREALNFSHQEIYENNNSLTKEFEIRLEKESIPAAGKFSTRVDFNVNYTGNQE